MPSLSEFFTETASSRETPLRNLLFCIAIDSLARNMLYSTGWRTPRSLRPFRCRLMMAIRVPGLVSWAGI